MQAVSVQLLRPRRSQAQRRSIFGGARLNGKTQKRRGSRVSLRLPNSRPHDPPHGGKSCAVSFVFNVPDSLRSIQREMFDGCFERRTS